MYKVCVKGLYTGRLDLSEGSWLSPVVFLSVAGAFLLFSQKKMAKLKQTSHSVETDAHGRRADVKQVVTCEKQLKWRLLQCQNLSIFRSRAQRCAVSSLQVVDQWLCLDQSSRSKYLKKVSRCPEPCLSVLRPDVSFGSVSETFNQLTEQYLQNRSGSSQDILDTDRYWVQVGLVCLCWPAAQTYSITSSPPGQWWRFKQNHWMRKRRN